MSSLPLHFSITKLVQRHMQKLYPLALADKSWDNVGLLLEPPFLRAKPTHTKPKVLLTIDLTVPVCQEALDEKSGVETIVTYHPIIFRGLKSLTLGDPQQEILMRLCNRGIGVYSPHTSVDGAVGGVNDWLASVVTQGTPAEISTIVPCKPVDGHEGGGYGRVVALTYNLDLKLLIDRIKTGLGVKNLQYAPPVVRERKTSVRTIALCAGSGASVFQSLSTEVDALFTGELSHHEVLSAVSRGQHVILCGHTNTERGFLEILQQNLQTSVDSEIGPNNLDVIISEKDRHPLFLV